MTLTPPTSFGVAAVTVAGSVSVSNFPASQAVTGPLTDAQLRAVAVPVLGSVSVGNFPATQPISAASLPLPTGAATAAAQTDGSQRVGGTVAVSGPLTDTQLRASAVPVDGSAVTQPVSAAALPLPAGAAKDSTLTDGTQRVGGTVAVSAVALPLPAGAARDVTLTDGTQRVGGTVAATQSTSPWVVDASGVPVPVTGPLTDTQLRASPVDVDASGTAVPVTGPLTDAELRASAVPVDGSGVTQPVSGTVEIDGVATEATLARVNGAVQDSALTAIIERERSE